MTSCEHHPYDLLCACCRAPYCPTEGHWFMVRGTARFLCWGCVDILARHQVKRSRTTDQAQAVSEFNHGTERLLATHGRTH